ncbi:MAG TPA: hypothetical protein VGO80_03625 [Solirubrobacteraceae bacterium]|jgi:hypothetical protein|nr:hypothetical protein [Solirubrobacteraceae bacterium]
MAKMAELKRAAEQLGVTSMVLRQQGWATASPARVEAVKENPPDWLLAARQRRARKVAVQQRRRARKRVARRLGIQERAVRQYDIERAQIDGLLADPPQWLRAEQARREALARREAKYRLRGELADALVRSVQEAWFQEPKRAASDAEAAAIDARWAPEIRRAKRDARELVDELSEEQVRARIAREQTALDTAARYRAQQLAVRAFAGTDG